jgi:tetratricopeptide (TPR) repeat protein
MKDYYKDLNISSDASIADIKKAYFSLVRIYPPDKQPDEFMKIREAYEVLIDESTRKQYDAVDSMPDIVKTYYRHGRKALEEGDLETAIHLLEMVSKAYPSYSVVNSLLGEAYLSNENSNKAIRVFEELVKQEKNNAGFVRQLALAYAMRGWRKKAITMYHKALKLDEDNLSLWLGLIDCYVEGEEFDQAYETIQAGLEVSNQKGWNNIPLYIHGINADIFIGGAQNLQQYLTEIKEKALENEDIKENVGWYLAELAGKLAGLDFYEETAQLIAAASELMPEDQTVRQMKAQYSIMLQLNELDGDDNISIEIDEMLNFEANMLVEADSLDIQVTRLFFEMDIIMDLDSYRREIIHLKNNYPELYRLKKEFFDNVLNRKKEKYLHDTYGKKFRKYMRLCPDRFETDDEDEDSDRIPEPFVRPEPKVGRNDPCPCGSGKKYKKCCLGRD